ncbi:MAG: phenylalanine--tRNA ligase subunit beta [Planctomycetes bacterium]|nr:phenylalanine--tRNA ligase subunit beta [Planctomycetota bacterium]
MKVPLHWLRDYVPLSIGASALIDRLTISGLEVAAARFFGLPIPDGLRVKQEDRGPAWDPKLIVVAEVVGVEKHPNADKLKLVQLDYGAGTPKQVVTGAPNIAIGDKGQKVVLGMSGCTYFDGHATPKAIKELKPSNLRGVPSDAMVMSTFELGIDEEHEGIIILEGDAPVGKPLVDFMGDVVIEIDVLPNMARCLSMIGVAREVAALTGQQAVVPVPEPVYGIDAVEGKVQVEIADPKLCPRYSAMLIRDVTIQPSPGWMQRRLAYSGMRPISNIVDITNYVMLEYGQPLHAFDYDILVKRAGGKSPTITVRPAKSGEKMKTLDGVERELSPGNLLIADSVGPIALAGVMGGAETEVSTTTKNVLLESASFDFVSIRRTSKQFNLFSEASTRFSRGIHTEVVKPAALRAAQLMQQHAGGTVLRGMVDNYPNPIPVQTTLLKKSEIKRLLGIDFPDADVERILKSLDFKVEKAGADGWNVTTPPYRTDIQAGAADLIEELARIYGYDRLPSKLLSGELPPWKTNRALQLEERVRDILASSDLHEVMTYSLTSKEREAALGLPAGEYVEVLNEISADRKVMRQSVLASVLEVAKQNLLTAATIRLFEIGFVYLPKPGQRLPDEPRRLSIVLTGRRDPAAWDDPQGVKPATLDFFDLKGIIETLVADLHLPSPTYRPAPSVPFLHPGRSAELLVGGDVCGCFGEMHPKTVQAFELGERAVLVADLDLEKLLAKTPERFPYSPVPRFPAALRDVALIVEETIPNERIVAEMRAAGGELLNDARLFDVYRGDPIPAGSKSLAYALSYQAVDRTLTDKEIDKAHKKIEDRLRHVIKARIRGKDEA